MMVRRVSGCFRRGHQLPAFCTRLPQRRHFIPRSETVFFASKASFPFASSDKLGYQLIRTSHAGVLEW